MSVSLYSRLDVTNQKIVHHAACEPLKGKFTANQFKAALGVLVKKEQVPEDPVVLQLIQALEDKALEHLEKPVVKPWKGVCDSVRELTGLCQIAALGLTATCMGSIGMSLFYLRSHRVIAVACGCIGAAAFALRRTALRCAAAAEKYAEAIENLTIDNVENFYSQLTEIYTGHKKTDFLARDYFHRQERAHGNTEIAAQLLNEQLAALRQMKRLFLSLYTVQPFVWDEKIETQPADIKKFFVRFEAFTRRGLLYGTGFTLGSMGWTAYTLMQRAYLMSLAGIVSISAGAAISHQLYLFNQGAKKIHITSDGLVSSAFQNMSSKISLLQRLGLQKAELKQIHQAFVIPCNEILKLIPLWNRVE